MSSDHLGPHFTRNVSCCPSRSTGTCEGSFPDARTPCSSIANDVSLHRPDAARGGGGGR